MSSPESTQNSSEKPPQRRPKSVYNVGSDPDVRFSLANERTSLAWIRTGLALIAGGIALSSLAIAADLPKMLHIIAAFAGVLGSFLALHAIWSWGRNEKAIRQGKPLPAPVGLFIFTGGIILFGLLLAGYAVLGIMGFLR